MPFKKDDPNINRSGRIAKEHKPTAKELKQKEFMTLLRKLKPLMGKSINSAYKVIENDDSTDASKLKAAALLLGLYKDLVKEVYDQSIKVEDLVDSDVSEIEDSKNAPVFSLTVLKSDEDKDE